MADTTTITNGKAKLPPLKPSSTTEDGDKPKKKVVRKKKKPLEETTSETGGEKPKTTPRRKKAASADSTNEAGTEAKTTPKKKKKVPKKKDDGETDPSSARSGASLGEDVGGSKASLIKSSKEGTPRKKKVKKKVKKTPEQTEEDGFFDSTLAEDLNDVQDDIVAHDATREDDDGDNDDKKNRYTKQPYSTASAVLRSQPTEKIYIETDGGFKGEFKSRFAKKQAEELKEKAIVHEEPTNTTIEFAIRTQRVIGKFCLFCHGLLAGFSAWHTVIAYILLGFGDYDFIEHYKKLALPVQCTFYFLLVLCTWSALDRSDIANPRRRFLLKAVTLQNGTVSVLLYFAALIISVSNGALEDKIHLYDLKPALWNNTATASEDLRVWRDLNTSRNVLSIVGWFVISLSPLADRLTENLKQTDDEDLLGVDVETGKSAIA